MDRPTLAVIATAFHLAHINRPPPLPCLKLVKSAIHHSLAPIPNKK
jgi:hypothetical protein